MVVSTNLTDGGRYHFLTDLFYSLFFFELKLNLEIFFYILTSKFFKQLVDKKLNVYYSSFNEKRLIKMYEKTK